MYLSLEEKYLNSIDTILSMRINKNSIASALFLLGAMNVAAQERTQEFTVDFPVGSDRLDLYWGANGRSIFKLTSFLKSVSEDPRMKINDITVYGTASPEGRAEFNRRLALRRRDALVDVIRQNVSVPDSVFTLREDYIQWHLLRGLVEMSGEPWRAEVLEILDGRSGGDDRIAALKRLRGGRVWRRLIKDFFPQMRSASAIVVSYEQLPAFREEMMQEPADTVVIEYPEEPVEEFVEETVAVDEGRDFYMDIRTNMLYDAALVPNIGVDFYLGKNFSVGGNWMYAWWSKDSVHRFWRLYGGDINARWWFGPDARRKPLTGHHLGVYAQMLTYDFEFGNKGYMGGLPGGSIWDRANWGAGVEYGFSLPVARRINIDFSLGIGYLGGKALDYRVIDGHYVWQSTKKRHWFGPTKAEISLVWLIGNGNYNSKNEKGGNDE